MSSPYLAALVGHVQTHADGARVPASAHAAVATFVFDSLAVGIAGTAVKESAIVRQAALSWGAGQDAHVWGTAERLPAPAAAMVNAFNIHNQEFDCVHEPAVVHPMAVILAALLAFADRASAQGTPVSGKRLSAALAIAVDVATVIGMSATRPIRFFRPAQCGTLGAAAGMCALAGADESATRNALGLAYSQLAGTMQAHIEGTPALALQVAFGARAAVCAVDLALAGFRGPHDILEGKHGYFALFEADAAPEKPFAELGRVWQIERVSHKPYPTGRAAQGGIFGLQSLMREHGFAAGDVASVELFAPPLVRQLVDRPMLPGMTVNHARLCMPFLAATTLLDGTVGLGAYRAERLASAELASLAARVKVLPDDNPSPNALRPQSLAVTLKDDRRYTCDMAHVYGAPESPMSIAAQNEKFAACLAHAPQALSESQGQALAESARTLVHLDDAADLARLASHTH
jgi:aconitate decarboxylase